jgi:hypothetical protein
MQISHRIRISMAAVLASAAVATTACSSTQAATKPVAKAPSHETMTAAQHSAMHGSSASSAADSSFADMQRRGQMAMGVDQYASAHKFDITPEGGRIELQLAQYDSLGVAQIRAHMKLIQHAFEAGDFTTPAFVHARDMPGTAVMASRRGQITYTYGDLPRGAEVRITTADAEARAAISQFMKAQRDEHHASGADAGKH